MLGCHGVSSVQRSDFDVVGKWVCFCPAETAKCLSAMIDDAGDVPVAKYNGRSHACTGQEEAIRKEADVVNCTATVSSDRGLRALVAEHFKGTRPRCGKALGAKEGLIQVAHQQDGAIRELRVDFEECRGELGPDPLLEVVVREVDAADDEGARQCLASVVPVSLPNTQLGDPGPTGWQPNLV